MRRELDNTLVVKYPKIFRDRYVDVRKSTMGWGIDCGNGWFDLIDKLCKDIQIYLNNHPKVEQVIAQQVKQKFGGLRFYASGGDVYTDKLISDAESKSYTLCENCGTTENVGHTSGWITTICKHCFDERGGATHQWYPRKS